ncbi:hypothetical protein MMC30_003486 [Trapelia coarctata]|nr:hypothetical protein [Trapelia coarctata]
MPRWLLPRGGALLHLQKTKFPSTLSRTPRCCVRCRYASNTSSKPRVLEKPAKFNPPSHPARLNRPPPRQYPGPPLSASEMEAQKTKQYPHMMPPEGSFMHWFLTNRSIHVYITLSTLFTLALLSFVINFKHTSPFAHLLPAGNTFYSHPLDYISTWLSVYKTHTLHVSAETAERRRKKVEDVQKRALYRKAHGLDKEQGLGGWTAKGDDELLGPAIKSDARGGGDVAVASDGRAAVEGTEADEGVYADFEGRRKRPLKKWLGIW